MSWDAFCTREDEEATKAFKEASHRVRSKCGRVDGFLQDGGLDCSRCARALEAVTELSTREKCGWSAKQVKSLVETALWPSDLPEDEAWAYESAREFLVTCADLDADIIFTW